MKKQELPVFARIAHRADELIVDSLFREGGTLSEDEAFAIAAREYYDRLDAALIKGDEA